MSKNKYKIIQEEFGALALEFCGLMGSSARVTKEEFLQSTASLLARLYEVALRLPVVELKGELPPDSPEEAHNGLFLSIQGKIGPDELYWEVFDPTKYETPVAGSLSDDLSDIYRDLKRGLVLVQKNRRPEESLWEWRFSFWSHWGDHAVDALRALHRLLQRT